MSGASTMRNSIKRITHKERSQPAARKRFGLLEKHKDYIERAKHYHKKKDYLHVLQKKAAERNPDEFYFKMNSSQVSKGIHKELDNGSLDSETVKLLKTQDTGYLVHKASIDMRKAEKLQSSLHRIGERRPRVHKTFVDTQEEVEEFDVAKHFDTAPELVDRSHNRPKIATLEQGSVIIGNPSSKVLRKIQKDKEKAYQELGMRNRRAKKLKKTIACVQLQRSLMGKGSKRKIVAAEDNGGVPVFKWKRQRAK